MDVNILKKYAELSEAYKQVKADKELLSKKIAELQPVINEIMLQAGLQSLKLDNGIIIYLSTEIWPKIVARNENDEPDKEAVIKALIKMGLGSMVQPAYSTQTLGAYVRERLREDGELPDEFTGIVEASKITKAKTRKS
jgi:hypothetical protein